jgi:hypothetical protein
LAAVDARDMLGTAETIQAKALELRNHTVDLPGRELAVVAEAAARDVVHVVADGVETAVDVRVLGGARIQRWAAEEARSE